MKILLINVVYEKGSTGNIVKTLFNNLNAENECFVIYGRGKHIKLNNIYKGSFEFESKFHHLISKFTGNMYGGMYFSTIRIISLIKKIKPDVVNLHCLNGYFVNIYKLLKWLAKTKIKTVLTMHADFMMTGGCGYSVDCKNYLGQKCKKCKYIREFNGKFSINSTNSNFIKLEKSITSFDSNLLKITTVSPWLTERYTESPIYKKFDIKTILNPVDEIFFKEPKVNPFNAPLNVLYVTPDIYDLTKSGWLINDIASLRKDIHFTVVCAKDVDFKVNSDNVTYIKGGLDKNNLLNYYFFSDATILLSKRETFSMIVAESLACGTPVCGFKSGGPESIAIDAYSQFFEYGNIEALASSLEKNNFNKIDIREKARKLYGSKQIVKTYLDFYNF